MSLPQSILIRSLNLNIPTISIFIALSILTFIYLCWIESKKEGFDQDKVFDIVFLVLLTGLLIFKIDTLLVITLAMVMVYILVNYWKWSVFRVMDILSISASAALVPFLFGLIIVHKRVDFIIPILINLILVIYLGRVRNLRFRSGYIFSVFLVVGAGVSAFYYRELKHLLFYVFLIMISIFNLYLREKKSMNKPNISLDFLNNIKKVLDRKEKRLSKEQELLIEEDPYQDRGRDTGNSELMDEALLEDGNKELVDIKVSALEKMQIQVRKALAKIKIGTYGICEVCGQPIDKARLQAYPEAITCMEHASRDTE